MKKLAIIAGAMALAGALFLASPVSAQDGPSMSATLNDDGSATVSGTGWGDAPDAGLFVTMCPGADVTADPPINAGNALTACPTLIPDSSANNPTVGDDGTWTFEIAASTVGTVPDDGVVILTGCLPLGCTTHSATTILTAAAAEEMADTGAESGLLAVIGVSVLLAGLFAVGIGRRFAKRS